jgi:hypothetical protein
VQHHDDTLDAYIESVRATGSAIGVIVVGSVARGTERADSDVDVYLIVTPEAFDRAFADNRLSYVDRDVATYAGGYVDIKVATSDYLGAAAERGDDPVRASFQGARVAWAGRDLRRLVTAIPVLPAEVWEDRAASFIAQVRLHGGYLETTIGTLDRVPAGYGDLALAVLTDPGPETAVAYTNALEEFHPWPLAAAASLSTFVRDNELAWLTGVLPPEAS